MDDHHFTYITKLKKKAKKERKTASNKPKLEEVFFFLFFSGKKFSSWKKKNKYIFFNFLGDFLSQGFEKTNSENPPDFYITFAVGIFCTIL
jgi:hypothetical protein